MCINWRRSRPISEWESTHLCKYQYGYGVTERLGVGKPPVFDTLIPHCSHNYILLDRPVLSIVHNILALYLLCHHQILLVSFREILGQGMSPFPGYSWAPTSVRQIYMHDNKLMSHVRNLGDRLSYKSKQYIIYVRYVCTLMY